MTQALIVWLKPGATLSTLGFITNIFPAIFCTCIGDFKIGNWD